MPGLVSDQLIANLRKVAYKQLVTPVDVYRHHRIESDAGTEERHDLEFSTLCWFIPVYKGNLTTQVGGLIANDSGSEFRFKWDEDIQVGDQLVVAGDDGYIVQDVNRGATIQLYLKAWTQRLE